MSKKILVLAPHTDDGELGCGGTIARYIGKGYHVKYVAFSSPLPELEGELHNATSILGIKDVTVLDFPIRRFNGVRQDILELLYGLWNDYDPTIVFLPSKNDVHQDHHVIYQEGLRAFKKTKMLSYELPWNNIEFMGQYFVPIAGKHLEKKLLALKEYKTQKDRDYFQVDFIKSLAKVRGVQMGKEYAECFEVVRWVV